MSHNKSASVYKMLSVIKVSVIIRCFIPREHTRTSVRISLQSIEENVLSSCPKIALPDRRKNENKIPFLDDSCRRQQKQSTQYEGIWTKKNFPRQAECLNLLLEVITRFSMCRICYMTELITHEIVEESLVKRPRREILFCLFGVACLCGLSHKLLNIL